MRTWNAPPIRTPSSQPRGGVSPWERYPRSHLKSSRTWWHGANQPLANGHGSEPSRDREGAVFRNPQPRAALAVNNGTPISFSGGGGNRYVIWNRRRHEGSRDSRKALRISL